MAATSSAVNLPSAGVSSKAVTTQSAQAAGRAAHVPQSMSIRYLLHLVIETVGPPPDKTVPAVQTRDSGTLPIARFFNNQAFARGLFGVAGPRDDFNGVGGAAPATPHLFNVIVQDFLVLDADLTAEVEVPVLFGPPRTQHIEARQVSAARTAPPRHPVRGFDRHAVQPRGATTAGRAGQAWQVHRSERSGNPLRANYLSRQPDPPQTTQLPHHRAALRGIVVGLS